MATHCARHRRRCRRHRSGVVDQRSSHPINRQNQHAQSARAMNGFGAIATMRVTDAR
jgi:hypothetical protein